MEKIQITNQKLLLLAGPMMIRGGVRERRITTCGRRDVSRDTNQEPRTARAVAHPPGGVA